MMARALFFIAAALSFALAAPVAQAMNVERIVSPSGIEAWLVQDKSGPLVAMSYAFHGGASQDT
ncbi:MAG: insulinase family protein, partial [Pseudolabrys sp.]